MALKKSQKSLKDWTDQDWSTKSGKKSSETGERYLPKSAIDSLSSQEYAATTKKKREDTKKGKQHSKQPKKIAKKTAQHRYKGGLMSSSDDLVHPENKEFLENFHNEVVSSGSELVEDGRTTTMRITGIEIKGKEYLLPSYDPDTKTILDPKEIAERFMPLIESGEIEGYDSPEQAEEERKKFYEGIVQEKNEGGLVSDTSPRMKRAREAKEERQALGVPEDTTVQDAADIATDFVPVLGEVKGIRDTFSDLSEGDYVGAGINAAATLLGVVPVVGDAAGKSLKGAEGNVKKFVDEFVEAKNVEKTLENQPVKVEPPKKTKKAYKLFKTKEGNTDEFFPLFVNSNKGVVKDKWVQADVGPIAKSGKVKSKIGELAYRPGWHSGDYASATHIGGKSRPGVTKPDYRPANQVWAEVEVPDDVDWQAIANKNASVVKSGPNKGRLNAKEAHITDRVPNQGHYRYKTNPNMQGNWIISGELKVKKALSSDQVKDVASKTGIPDLPSLPELIQKEGLSLSDLNQESVKELKKYYPEVYSTLGEAVGKHKGGLMYGNKEYKKMYGGGYAKKDYSKYKKKKMNMGGYTGGMTQAMGMNPMFDETEEMPQMNCGGYMGGGMMSADVIVGIDPVSGNEIPLGSDAENVRDDIPAMLSEDEYVLPADVVKWHGLKHIQEMHDEASMGLMSMAMDGLVATGEPAVKSKDAEKVKQEYRTEKGSRKTPEGVEVELTAYEVEDNADLEKEDDSKYKSKVKGNMKEYGKGGLLGYAEGGLVDDEDPDPYGDLLDEGFEFDADMMNAEMLEEVAAEQRARDKELEPYMREESLSEEDAADLFDVDEEAGVVDVPDGGLDTTPVSEDEEISEDKVNKVAAALLKQANSYGGSGSEGAAFMSGLGNGVKMAELGKKVGDQLAEYETKSGNNPFGFLRDDKGFFRKRD